MTPVQIVCGRAGTLWPDVLKGIQATAAAGRHAVLLVPEQYTLQAEQDLIRDLKLPGLLDIDVMSPARLRSRVREYAGSTGKRPLNRRGKSMAVSRVLMDQERELEYYRHSAHLPGTARELTQTLEELQEAGITPEELEATVDETGHEGEQAKRRDLVKIWKAYRELVDLRFEDEEAVHRDILNRLVPSGVLKDADIWIYGFEVMRRTMAETVARMMTTAHQVTVTMVADRPEAPDGRLFSAQRRSLTELEKLLRENVGSYTNRWLPEPKNERSEELNFLEKNLFADRRTRGMNGDPKSIRIYRGANPSAEAGEVARTLTAWHTGGLEWKHMAVAVPASAGVAQALYAALSVSGIPYYVNTTRSASVHGLCRMLLGALRAVSDHYRTDHVIDVIRSGFTRLTEEETLRLEAYAESWGIDRKKWRQPFQYGEDAEAAEAARLKLMEDLETFHEDLKKNTTSAGYVEAVVRFLEKEEAYRKLREREEELLRRGLYAEATENRQIWKSLMEMLDQLWNLLGEKRASMRDMADLMAGGLEQITVSAVPARADSVMIGEPGHMLTGRVDGLICMGMQDGIMAITEQGVLSDRERRNLEEKLKRPVGMGSELKLSLRKSDYYRTFSLPTKVLKLTCSLSGEDGKALLPAALLKDLHELFPDLREEGSVNEEQEGSLSSPQAALEGLAARLRAMRTGETEDLEPEWKTALRCLWQDEIWHGKIEQLLKTVMPEENVEQVRKDLAGKLFLNDTVSISRLERFASCPYRHFVDYGLKPVRRKLFEFEINEKGSFYHEALDRYLKVAEKRPGWPEISREETDGIMDGILRELTEEWEGGPLREDGLGEWEGDDAIRQVRGAARTLTLYAGRSSFKTLYTEKAFGEEGELPPLILTPEEGSRVALRGRIDRIDAYTGPDGRYIRVVDNKSSQKTLDAAKIRTGEQLQLLLYLKAALTGIRDSKPAAALYFPVMDPDVSIPEDDPDQAEDARAKALRMKGVVLADPDVVEALDRDNPYSIGKVFNKDGSVSKEAGWAMDGKTLENLMDAASQKAEQLCTEMRRGDIQIAPAGDRERNACTYCDYRSICRRREDQMRPRDEKITFADVASEKKISYNDPR